MAPPRDIPNRSSYAWNPFKHIDAIGSLEKRDERPNAFYESG
jgi:hypothetical protein